MERQVSPELRYVPLPSPWPDQSPAFVGPVTWAQGLSRGGGRGIVATRAIVAGEKLIAEARIIPWPKVTSNTTLHTAMVRRILTHSRRDQFLKALQHVHPVTRSSVPQSLWDDLRKEHGRSIDRIAGECGVAIEEVERLFLVLQCSAHGSGLYLHLSLFNHASRPNAIKFTPAKSNVSEVFALQAIAEGEEVTLCYLEPAECTRDRQATLLQRQFGFIPTFPDTERFDLLEKYKNEQNPEFLREFELYLESVEVNPSPSKLSELVAKFEHAREIFDDRHILLLRIRKRIIEAVTPLVTEESEENDVNIESNLVLFLRMALDIYKTQLLWLPRDHIDFATTCTDITMGIESLLFNFPASLALNFPQWANVSAATRFADMCKKTASRLDKLYS